MRFISWLDCVLGCLTGFRLSLEGLRLVVLQVKACVYAGEGFKVCGLLFRGLCYVTV